MDNRLRAVVLGQLQDALHRVPYLAEKRPGNIAFSRPTRYGSQKAVLQCHDYGDGFDVVWSFQIDIDEVNAIHEKYLPVEGPTLIAGVNGFQGHQIESAKDVAPAIGNLVSEFKDFAMPFFEKHQSVTELDGIVNRSRKKWANTTPITAVILAKLSGNPGLEKVIRQRRKSLALEEEIEAFDRLVADLTGTPRPKPKRHRNRELVSEIQVDGFDPDGEPVIKVWADGSLWIHFEAMPPFFSEEDGTEDDFEDFQAVLQKALGVAVTQDDREVFVIEHPKADTAKKAKKWLESYHKKKPKGE